MNIKIYSFDVFDTCISRYYTNPSDVFYYVGLRIASPLLNSHEKRLFAIAFKTSRILAERQANNNHGHNRSCNIDDIYKIINIPSKCSFSISEIAKIELDIELECCYAIESTKDTISKIRSNGGKIIFTSDMYLTKNFISNLLNKNGFENTEEQIYVSSETSLTKMSGDLFKLILQNENIKPYELIHYGDNIISDVNIPKKLGIRTQHISHTYIKKHENIKKIYAKNLDDIEISGIAKFIRLTRDKEFCAEELKIFTIAAPMIVSFVIWAFKTAQKKSINNLYFLAKDGEILYKVAKILSAQFPSTKVSYLYGSRKSWLTPSINFDDFTWRRLAIPAHGPSSLNDVFIRLSIEQKEIDDITSIMKFSATEIGVKLSPDLCFKKLLKIIENEKCREILQNRISLKKAICLNYFKENGLLKYKTWAIVDSGWELNCQAALKRILNEKIVGLYFGISENHVPKELSGVAYAYSGLGSIFEKRRIAFEHIFLPASHSTTIAYKSKNGKLIPDFMPDSRSEFDITYANKYHDYITTYAHIINKFNLIHSFSNDLKKDIIKNSMNFLLYPNADAANYLSKLNMSAENSTPSEKHTRPLFAKMSTLNFFSYIKKTIFSQHTKINYVWIEGSAAISNKFVKFFYFLLKKISGL